MSGVHSELQAASTPVQFRRPPPPPRTPVPQAEHRADGNAVDHGEHEDDVVRTDTRRYAHLVDDSMQLSVAEVTMFSDEASPVPQVAFVTRSPKAAPLAPVDANRTPTQKALRNYSAPGARAEAIAPGSVGCSTIMPDESQRGICHTANAAQIDLLRASIEASTAECGFLKQRNADLEISVRGLHEQNAMLLSELTRASHQQREASICRDDREQECIELNSMVDQLHAEVDHLRAQLSQAEQRNGKARVDDQVQLRQLTVALRSQQEESNQLTRRLQAQVSALKLQLAEYQSVLDRLDLSPPFDEALLANASMRLKHLRTLGIVNATTTADVAASRPVDALRATHDTRRAEVRVVHPAQTAVAARSDGTNSSFAPPTRAFSSCDTSRTEVATPRDPNAGKGARVPSHSPQKTPLQMPQHRAPSLSSDPGPRQRPAQPAMTPRSSQQQARPSQAPTSGGRYPDRSPQRLTQQAARNSAKPSPSRPPVLRTFSDAPSFGANGTADVPQHLIVIRTDATARGGSQPRYNSAERSRSVTPAAQQSQMPRRHED